MAVLDHGFDSFSPAPEVVEEVARWVSATPGLRVLRPGSGAYYVVPVPIPGRPGTLYTSRVPGRHREHAAADVRALADHGVEHVVCLVARGPLVELHGGET